MIIIRKCIAMFMACIPLLGMSACCLTKEVSVEPQKVRATVMEIDKYGHAILNVTASDLLDAGYALGDVVHVHLGSCEADMPFFDGFYTNPGDMLLRGMTPQSNVSVCINYGDFSAKASVAVGDTAEITMAEKAGMLSLQQLCALHYSNLREDYASDAVFANFRAVTAGRIGERRLYRSASAIDNENGRAACANDLMEAAAVATVLNLADSNEKMESAFEAADFASDYYRDLYEAGNVAALDLTGNFYSEKFARSLAEGFTFLAQKEPPYAIHCLEGKDRAGFAAMLLEALMGARLQQIIDDYMISFHNYYGIDEEHEPERYQAVLDANLIPMLLHVTGAQTREELDRMDLEAAAQAYLLAAGMSQADITALQKKLD